MSTITAIPHPSLTIQGIPISPGVAYPALFYFAFFASSAVKQGMVFPILEIHPEWRCQNGTNNLQKMKV